MRGPLSMPGRRGDLPLPALAVLGAAVLAVALAAGPGPAAADDAAAVVTMDNGLEYKPESVTIDVGETVLWKNEGLLIHTVTADPERAVEDGSVKLPDGAETFHSGDLERGDTFRQTFEIPGEYTYFCVPHEADGMIGHVTVE